MTISVLIPVLLLGTAAFIIPLWTVPKGTPHVWDVTRGILLAGFAIFCFAMVVVALAFELNGADLAQGLGASPLLIFGVLASVVFKSAIAWGPVLLFMWVHMATKANARAGELMAQKGE